MKFLLVLLMTLLPALSYGDAVIFSGSDVKTLKPSIDVYGNAKILSGSLNPTSSAVNAPKGSIYLSTNTGFTYYKTDAGSSTNWQQLFANPMTTGGDLIYGGASGAPTRLANGTSGYVLQANGGTSAQTWVKPVTITAWDVCTPTVSPITGFTAGPTMWWRRVGDTMEGQFILRKNGSAPSGGTTLTTTLCGGVSIDFGKHESNNGAATFGNCQFFTSSFAGENSVVFSGSSSTIAFSKTGSGSPMVGTDMTANTYLSCKFTLPISGWTINN